MELKDKKNLDILFFLHKDKESIKKSMETTNRNPDLPWSMVELNNISFLEFIKK